VTNLVRKGLEVPDVDDGHGQRDVSHALTAYRLLRHFDTTAVTDDAFVANTLVFTTMALPVLYGAEDLLTEETFFLRLERAIVDRLGLQHLPVGALQDGFWRSQADGDAAEVLFDLLGFSVRHIGESIKIYGGWLAGCVSRD